MLARMRMSLPLQTNAHGYNITKALHYCVSYPDSLLQQQISQRRTEKCFCKVASMGLYVIVIMSKCYVAYYARHGYLLSQG